MSLRATLAPLLTTLVVGATVLSACTSSPNHSLSTTTTTQPSRPVGGTGSVTVAVPSLPTNFNPSTTAGATRITNEVMAQVWPQSFVTDDHFQQTLDVGAIDTAEVVGLSPFTVSYTIDPNAVWSDGVSITAADFIYNWHEQLRYAPTLPEGGLVAGYRSIARMTPSPDGHTLTVVFRHQFAEWESLFANLVPAHIAEQYGWVAAFNGFDPRRVISGGPYVITKFVPGKELVLSRNTSWWSTPARLAHIVIKEMGRSAALAAVADGSVGVAEVAPGADVTSTVARAASAGISLADPVSELPYLWQLCLNINDPVLSDISFRQGLAYSLDRGQIVADSAGLDDASLAATNSRLTLAGQPGSNATGSGASGSGATSTIPGYEPSTALHLFDLAGYSPDSSGALRAGGLGPRLTLSLLAPRGLPAVDRAAEELAGQLQLMGVAVTIHQVPLATLLGTLLPRGEYQLALAPFLVSRYSAAVAPDYSTPVVPSSGGTVTSTSSGSGGPSPGATSGSGSGLAWASSAPVGQEPGATAAGVVTRDVFGLDDPVFDRLLTQALANLSLTAEEQAVNSADAQLWADLPTIPLFQQPVSLVHTRGLTNVSESPGLQGPFWDAQTWSIVVPQTTPTTSVPAASGGSAP